MNLPRRLLLPRRLFAMVAAVLLAALMAPTASQAALPPMAVDDESEFESVAKATATLAKGELVWQASLLPTVADAEQDVPFGTGFLYAGDGTIIVSRRDSDRTTRLRKGTALSVEAGTRLAPVSFTGDEIDFLALELLPEEDAVEPAGDAFDLAQGDYALELRRAELPAVEVGDTGSAPVELEAEKLPILVVVVSGEVDLTVGDADSEILEAGEALAVTDDATIARASEDEAVVLAVTIETNRATGTGASSGVTGGGSGAEGGGGGAPSGGGTGAGPASGGQTASPSPSPAPSPSPSPSPAPVDTDSDGLSDADENSANNCSFFSDPTLADTDGDGLGDFQECLLTRTRPDVSDTDYDALSDGDEIANGTDPLVSNDRDGDGLPDGYETPVNYGTNPDVADTDGDGLNDRQELDILTNPLVPDTDGDGLGDGGEASLGTNPLVPDSDGDGFPDGLEVNQFGTDPKNPVSHP